MRNRFCLSLIAFLLVSACTLQATNLPTPTPISDILYTQAVETIIAQMTESIATPGSPSVVEPGEITPTDNPLPAATATLPLPTAAPTMTPTPTFVNTLPPTLVPTLPASDPRASLGEPAFRDPLDNAENWPIYTDDHVSFEVKDGQMFMTAFKPDFYNGWMLSWINPVDFYLEITATHGACGGRDRFGVVFRAPEDDAGYLYGFSCDGRYSLWYWDGENEIDLIDWTSSALISAGEGQINRLGVRVEGNRFALYANGSLLTEVQDNTSKQGEIGLFVGSVVTEKYTVRVDELAYWNLK